VKVGDLVTYTHDMLDHLNTDLNITGIIIEVINDIEAPPVCKILWHDGAIDKEWTDDLEVLNESR
jgi:hypothetical protein